MAVDWVVSQGDVEKHKDFGKVPLETILAAYGMDVSKGFISDGRNEKAGEEDLEDSDHGFTHRSVFTGEIHTCPRYYGEARTDGAWKRFTENFVEI